jgi:ABC-2 type transport system ATP-binding protein/ribosome-dependent ATPase
MTETTAAAVEATSVTRTFGRFTAVDDVDLDVGEGEIVGLLGANGAGKTTMMKMLLGLLRPTSGRVRLMGRPPDRSTRARIGYVPQNLGLYPDLTVDENLALRAAMFDCPSAAAPDGYGDELVGATPLGVQRRVAFAAATAHSPPLLLLDEPTSGVSPLERSRLWDLIHRQAATGSAVLVSTHYLDEAEQADRLVILARGRVVATGTASGIVGDHRTVEVTSEERWAEIFERLDGDDQRLALAGRRIRVMGHDRDTVASMVWELDPSAIVRSVPATLEEVLIDHDATVGRSVS